MPACVLVVDDEVDLVRLVEYNLRKEGLNVLCAYDGKGTLAQLKQTQPDLIILDLMLPDLSGFALCEKIKQTPSTRHIPIIMLTARSSEADRIGGFEAGAEDYIVKPFSPKELVLRVKAMLARTKLQSHTQTASQILESLGALKIAIKDHTVQDSSGRFYPLSHLEFELFSTLAKAPNRVKTREQLIEAIWGLSGEELSDRTIDTHIKRIRQKLGPYRACIETIRGVGYRAVPVHLPTLSPPVTPPSPAHA